MKLLSFPTLAAAVALTMTNALTGCKTPAMTGAYDKAKRPTTEEIRLFSKVATNDRMQGLKIKKVARQVVAGMNYKYLCVDADGNDAEVVIYVPLPDQGEPSVVSITATKKATKPQR